MMSSRYHKSHLLTMLAAGALTLSAVACSDSARHKQPVPRPVAYPRIEVPGTCYVKTVIRDIPVTTNAAATVTEADDDTQFTIRYSDYGAEIYCTVTPIANAEEATEVIANRTERMALNAGSNTTEVIDIPAANGSARVTVTPTGSPTPVQFIACRADYILSGAAYLPDCATQRTDTLQPVVDFLRRDIIRLVTTLP